MAKPKEAGPTLEEFLQSRYVAGRGQPFTHLAMQGEAGGRWFVPPEDTAQLHDLVYERTRLGRSANIMETHLPDGGPITIDLDFKYRANDDAQLRRRFTADHIRRFVGAYVAAATRFVDPASLPPEIAFWGAAKDGPERDTTKGNNGGHKDGVHLMCPDIRTDFVFQYAMRGFLLEKDVVTESFRALKPTSAPAAVATGGAMFVDDEDATPAPDGRSSGSSGSSGTTDDASGGAVDDGGAQEFFNEPSEVFDVSVIYRNSWFLYGAAKPQRQPYRLKWVLRVTSDTLKSVAAISDFSVAWSVATASLVSDSDALRTPPRAVMDLLSIRRPAPLTHLRFKPERLAEWEALREVWRDGSARGAGRARAQQSLKDMIASATATAGGGAAAAASVAEEAMKAAALAKMTATAKDVSGAPLAGVTVRAEVTEEDAAMALRLVAECLDPERRARTYGDWFNLGMCLYNITSALSRETQERAFAAWVAFSRRVQGFEATPDMVYADKWRAMPRIAAGRNTIKYGSLVHWAKQDNEEQYKVVKYASDVEWLIDNHRATHVNIANLVTRRYGTEFRYTARSKRSPEWYQYRGHAWRRMVVPADLRARLSNDIRSLCNATISIIHGRLAVLPEGDDRRKRLEELSAHVLKLVHELEMTKFKDNVMTECAEKFYEEDFAATLNTNPYLVGCANGVLELRHIPGDGAAPTVLFRDGRPDDYVSFQLGRDESIGLPGIEYQPYDPKDPQQRELAAFFERIYPDPILRKYVLTLLAACLEGRNAEQKFYILQGCGGNGKSMVVALMTLVFGDYTTSLATTAVTRKRPDSGNANPDIVPMRCRRFISLMEPDAGEHINSSCVKQLTGGDAVPARGLYEEQSKFIVMGRLFMSCNDLPPVPTTDVGTWRRFRIIPHRARFIDVGAAEGEDPANFVWFKDLSLEKKLPEWRGAFLSLLVHYYQTVYLREGLVEPEAVRDASDKYQATNDAFKEFVGDNFERKAGASTTLSEAWAAYRDWTHDNLQGRRKLVKKEFEERCVAEFKGGSRITAGGVLGIIAGARLRGANEVIQPAVAEQVMPATAAGAPAAVVPAAVAPAAVAPAAVAPAAVAAVTGPLTVIVTTEAQAPAKVTGKRKHLTNPPVAMGFLETVQ